MINSMCLRSADSRTEASGPLRNARQLWQCRGLTAVLVLATIAVSTNSAGSATNSAATTVADATATTPSITTQPADQVATAGHAATFTVVAAGTASLSYQWQKNGSAISGATSSTYTTPATTSSDSGALFAVVVSSSAGSTTSNAATLTIVLAVIDGINLPASHPRLFWNAAKLAQAQQWWTGHSYTPNYANPNPFDPYDTLLACELANNQTWCDAQINWAVNLSASNCYQSSGCDPMRIYGEAVMLTYDWLYAQMTAAQRTTIINNWNTWQNYPDTNDSWGNTGMPSSVDFAGGLRTDFSLGVATFGDNPAAPSFIDYTLNNRWAAVLNFASPTGVAPLGAKGYGMPAQESSQHGQYFLNYHAVPLASSALLGRDLWQESTALKAGVLQTIYNTLPSPTISRGLYDGWTWSDDENWRAAAGLYGGGGMQSRYYGDFMMAAAQEFPSTAVGKVARQWINTVNPVIAPMWRAIDPGGSGQGFSTLPLDYYASGPLFAYWRSNWNTNASSLFLQMGQTFGVGHTHFDEGNFQWFRGGSYLIRETPSYYTTVAGYDSVGTVDVSSGYAHNIPLIGGLPGSVDSCTDSNAIVRRMESQSAYAYLDADISGTYTNNICDPGRPERENIYAQHVEREFIFFRDIEVLLILDRLQADSASRSKTFVSHCETSPISIDAAHYVCMDGSQEASYSVLLPSNPALVAVNESANAATCAPSECQYRLEVNDKIPIGAQSYFLVAIQGLNAGATALTPAVQDNGASWTVTLDVNHVVTLNKGMVSAGGSITISGANTNLRADAQTMTITDDGPVWAPASTTAPIAPTITTQPANQTVTAEQTATFTVVAAGTAPLGYQWQKNGVNVAGATAASYTTPMATTADSGSAFAVVVSNTAGTVTSSAATLTVNPAPVAPTITTQPANQTVTAGQTATFTVVAAGTAPLSYRWQKNGVNIASATSASYTTPVTTTADSGSAFAVVVSNTAGTVTSAPAMLTVNPAPAPAIQVNPTSFNFGNAVVGTKLSQVLIVKNTGTATLSITQVTETGSASFTVSGFSLPLNVSAGQQTTMTVAFQPTAVGATSGNISIVSNAPTSPTTVALAGTGIAATLRLGISPTSLSFGNVTTGTSSATQNVTITNTGNANVTISQINLSGAGYSMTGGGAPVTITPSQNLILTVQFSPTTAGAASGTISIVSNASGSPAAVSLSGTGVAPVQHSVALAWNPSTSTVSGYNVYRSTVSGSSYTKINPSLVTLLNYTDLTVQSGTTYFYVTTAMDSNGDESVHSNEVSASVP